MTLVPVTVEQFGGLDLRADPEEVGLGGAIDLLNVDFDRLGRVRSRDGYVDFSAASSTQFLGLFVPPVGGSSKSPYVVANDAGTFRAYTTAGALIASSTTLAGTLRGTGIASIGTATASYTYAGTLSGARRFDGSSWSVVALAGGEHLAVTPWDNRMANARTGSYDHRVYFSAPGDPEDFTTALITGYNDLAPGDGSPITAMVAWRDFLFVFKSSKFFVFYGTSTTTSGAAEFNYRTVDTGIGATFGSGTAVAGPDGVYFINSRGMWRTTGGAPEKVSFPIEPWWVGDTQAFFAAPAFGGPSTCRLGRVGDRIWVSFVDANAAQKSLVYDCVTGFWLYHDLPTVHVTGAVLSTGATRSVALFSLPTAQGKVQQISPSATTDNGTNITSRYRSGFGDLGFPGQEKVIRETELIGIGAVQFGYSRDFGSITTTSQANVTLGTSPATARKLHRKSQDGELFSWQANSVTGGAWTLNRLTAFVRDVRGPAETTA